MILIVAAVVLTRCDHVWIEATCMAPQTCEKCGKTELFSNGTIADNFDYPSPVEGLVECPVCGTLRDPNGGCPHCAMNNAADRISTAPKAPKKGRQGEKPPWEK